MWKNGIYLLWSHIKYAFEENLNTGAKLLPRLTGNHVDLTSYSVLNVRLVAQVMKHWHYLINWHN
jgi:hypothetical protein